MKKKIIKLFFILFIGLTLCFLLFLALDYAYPLDTNTLKKEQSRLLYDVNKKLIAIRPSSDGIWRLPSQDIPQTLKDAVLLFEDRYFYYHFGINPLSIIRSFFYNLTHKNRIGASTITMQVARMMSPKKRTYKNKIKEIFNALQLEWHFSKDEILQFYFTLAPYGGNIEGVATGANFYFNKNLDELSIAQIALLSTIPKNPNKNRLDKKSNINESKNRVIKLLLEANLINQSQFDRAKKEPFKNIRFNSIYLAPHYSNLAFKNGLTNTDLNLDLQKILEQNLNIVSNQVASKNAKNAAGIIIDNNKMSVVAYVGSHNLKAKDGQNDGVMMSRNVGSTLKPFIYSLALDNGLITPKMQLIDTEIFINEYVPQNYNYEFLGTVSASQALALSLNIPAITLNSNLKQNSLYEMLFDLNLVNKSKEFYGDSITLGSAEMSLFSLAHLYTIYANEGILKPILLAGKIYGKEKKIISKEAAFLTTKMLSEANRSYLGNFWQYAKDTPQIAFKTGTSYGSRDIYAIGVNKDYVVAVWFGNFNGEKTQNLSGLKDAVMTIFNIFKILAQKQNLSFFEKPNNIKEKLVCLDAFNFNECKNLQKDSVIDGKNIVDRCDILRAEELNFMLKNKLINQEDIKQSPCLKRLKSTKPLIAKPFEGQVIISNEKQSKIMIKCYPYVGDEFFYKIDNNEFQKAKVDDDVVLWLKSGEHKISCLDENSNLSEIKITIKEF